MKSALFYSISQDSDSARTLLLDLCTVLRLTGDQREACLSAICDVAESAMTRAQEREVSEQLALDQDIPRVDAAAVLRALEFLARQLANEEFAADSIEDLSADLQESAMAHEIDISDADILVFAELLTTLRESIVPEYKKIRTRKVHAIGVLPSLKSFGTTVELRAITEDKFRVGMSADEYEPEITGLVAVVSVRLTTDSGLADEFCFQASAEEFDVLIEALKATQKDLKKIELRANSSWPIEPPEKDVS